MISRTTILLLCLALLPFACSGNGAVTDLSAIDGINHDAGFDLRHDGGRDLIHDLGRPPACLTQDTKVQTALDAARKSPNALLVIRNTACGTSVYISGDGSTGTASSLWRIGSVTKTYVAATVFTFIREGKLALSDPLSSWISGVPNTDGVT